jgi:hypothetical protein
MILFDYLGKIGGLNRTMWTVGAIIYGYFYKDRLVVEVTESLYLCK